MTTYESRWSRREHLDRRHARWAAAGVWTAGLAVAIAAAAATAHGLYEVVRASGAPAIIAGLYPLITDGLALVAYAATTRLSGHGRRYAWTIVVAAAGLSGLAQATYLAGGVHTAPGWLRAGVGGWPAIAAAIVAHLLYLLGTDRERDANRITTGKRETDARIEVDVDLQKPSQVQDVGRLDSPAGMDTASNGHPYQPDIPSNGHRPHVDDQTVRPGEGLLRTDRTDEPGNRTNGCTEGRTNGVGREVGQLSTVSGSLDGGPYDHELVRSYTSSDGVQHGSNGRLGQLADLVVRPRPAPNRTDRAEEAGGRTTGDRAAVQPAVQAGSTAYDRDENGTVRTGPSNPESGDRTVRTAQSNGVVRPHPDWSYAGPDSPLASSEAGRDGVQMGSAKDRALRSARDYETAHGDLPTATLLMEAAEVGRGTAGAVLKQLRDQQETGQSQPTPSIPDSDDSTDNHDEQKPKLDL